MELFARRSADDSTSAVARKETKIVLSDKSDSKSNTVDTIDVSTIQRGYTFSELGLCDWLCLSTNAIGYKRPTDIQRACIPAILEGRDVLACAETGSGKTAAFVLPMLDVLSQDPYGIFAIILTPTRELAIQISEQIAALGSSLNVTVSLSVGGLDLIEQRLSLARRPHFVVATPGRLRHHLESADPPNLKKVKYLVLDEADRLLAIGFSSELELIISKLSNKRQTLLFSATLTSTLEDLEQLALKDALRFDLTVQRRIPTNLIQQYLFLPNRVKICFLIAVIQHYLAQQIENNEDDDIRGSKKQKGNKKVMKIGYELSHALKKKGKSSDIDKIIARHSSSTSSVKSSSSIIIFVESCHRCHEISLILKQVNIDCVALHSMLNQTDRLNALQKFKSMQSNILVATDVASRGLDIPAVDLVLNFDLPKIISDYVHRIGRTARAGRAGRAVSFVTQFEIELLQQIEAHIEMKLAEYTDVTNEDIVPLLNVISKAMHEVQLDMMSSGFLDQEQQFRKRKRKQNKTIIRKKLRADNENSASSS